MVSRSLLLALAAGTTHAAVAALPNEWIPSTMIEPAPIATPATPDQMTTATARPAVYSSPSATTSITATTPDDDAPSPRDIECMAKVIVHEAGNQPRVGQVAVAQVIRTRLKDGRFADSVCGVVKQPGQFFDVDAYHPSRSDDRWAMATDIAVATLKGDGKDIVPGALFFHSGGVDMPTRTRLAQIADHTFYR